MARHRQTRGPVRTVLATLTALMAGWLLVFGTAAAAPAAAAAVGGTAPARAAEAVSPLMEVPPGTYRIMNRANGWCLRAGPETNPANGRTGVYVGTNCSDSHSLWTFAPSGYGWPYTEVRSVVYGECLDADNRSGRLTGIVHIYPCNQSPNQAWDFLGGSAGLSQVCVAAAYWCEMMLTRDDLRPTHFGNAYWARMTIPNDGTENSHQLWYLQRVS